MIKQTPHHEISELPGLIRDSAEPTTAPSSDAPTEASESGLYTQVTGAVQTDNPIHCALSQLKVIFCLSICLLPGRGS